MTRPAIIVDIDGTVALRGERGPFEWDKVGEDLPNQPIVDLVETLARYLTADDAEPVTVLFVSGRDAVCEWATRMWLDAQFYLGDGYKLFMRPEGDNRPDTVIKREIYDEFIKDQYDVSLVLDDRNKVVKMWREDLGLTVLQVADGNF